MSVLVGPGCAAAGALGAPMVTSVAATATARAPGRLRPRPRPAPTGPPAGSDRAPGTAGRPVRSLQRAPRHSYTQRNGDLTADLTVHLAPGIYRLAASLVLDARDTGSNGHRVIWDGGGRPGGGAIISGGHRIIGWHPVGGRSACGLRPRPPDSTTPASALAKSRRHKVRQGRRATAGSEPSAAPVFRRSS